MARTPAQIRRRPRPRKKDAIPIDTTSEKPRRGRIRKIQPSWVRGTADNYRWIFDLIWQHIWPGLATAQTQQEVIRAVSRPEVGGYALDLIRQADLILLVLKDRKFPKNKRRARINFLADSIAAHGVLTPRSSRDVCERERARIKRVHRILSYEFYIQCSCGYKGHSRNHACPNCEAAIPLYAAPQFNLD